ncbi:MAG: hypothetical protein LCH57_14235, partial [Proteobacteria bacterium]|nr:hypothetical protein [Pseudomonadota bacterium]
MWAVRVVCCRLFAPRINCDRNDESIDDDPLLSLRCSAVRVLEARRLSRLLDDWCAEARHRAPKD